MTNEQGGLYFHVIGLARTGTKIGLMNLVYNMRRLVQIDCAFPGRMPTRW